MPVIDLSHTITPDMPVFPGTAQPLLENTFTHEEHGFFERRLTFFSHTGTHLDAPAHAIPKASTLDRFDVGAFCGPACVLDCRACRGGIAREHLLPFEEALRMADFALLHTGWTRFWGDSAYFDGFPVLTTRAAEWLMDFGLKGVGVDAISVDPADSTELPVHHVILGCDAIIIENLTNLDRLPQAPEAGIAFSCLPLKLVDVDGSPTRAVAMLE
jgi:kynurenine formamidase